MFLYNSGDRHIQYKEDLLFLFWDLLFFYWIFISIEKQLTCPLLGIYGFVRNFNLSGRKNATLTLA